MSESLENKNAQESLVSKELKTDEKGALSAREQYELLQKESKELRKKMLKAGIILVAVLAAIFCLVLLMDFINQPTAEIPEDFYRFEAPYQGNIMENAAYLGKDRLVYYRDNPSENGLREAITEENKGNFDAGVLFLCSWLDTIIAGDAQGYNACFSEQYWKENEADDVLPKTAFNPQMLYDINLTYYSVASENGEKLTTYKVEYRILQNDGTFRRDIGSGVSREQRVTVRVRNDGTAIIEKLVTVYGLRENTVIEAWHVLVALGVVGVGVATFFVIKKKRKVKSNA